MILLDVNLLLYAYDAAALEHSRAGRWLERTLSGSQSIALTWPTILSFLRISTAPKMIAHPLELASAVAIVEEWLKQPNVSIVGPTEEHWRIFSKLLPKSRVRGSLIMDAHLAALAIEHGATLCTNDRDFARFPGLKVEFPLE
ncbi:MAG TPA: type II toxin-antitoxin system VapC family toxin [Bryobacteraceae bacterium]|nr:type II toxin-antitoxin system VapC family toxin [Bryobacteraceae bacterium]